MVDIFLIQRPWHQTMLIPCFELCDGIGVRVHVGIAHHHTLEINESILVSCQNFVGYCVIEEEY
jgi:hypothetical protein